RRASDHSADSEGAGAEVAPVEREVEMASGTEVFPVEAGEEEKADLGRKFPDLRGLDHNGQVAALVAEGWPEEDAKFYALGRLMRETIRDNPWAGQQREYWESYQPMEMDWESQRKMMEAHLRMQEAMTDLLGDDVAPMFEGIDLPFSREKARAAMMVQMDYQLMEMKLHHDSGGIMLEEDIEARRLLEEAKRKDLEAILTPEEMFEFEVRNSSGAGSLRAQLGAMKPTEEEFREI